MHEIEIKVPRINPNDDELLVVDILIANKSKVKKGDKLCIFETTKAAVDFESEFDGVIKEILIKKNEYYAVGQTAFKIESETNHPENKVKSKINELNNTVSSSQKISLKAQKILIDNNLSLKDLNLTNKEIKSEDVIKFLNLKNKNHINPKNLVIGSGMHATLVADILSEENIKIEGFISENDDEIGKIITKNLKVISSDKKLKKDINISDYNFYMGVGGADNNLNRIKVFEYYKTFKSNLPNLISSKANVSQQSQIGEGSIVLPGANIGPNVVIGKNCIINSNSVICHDTVVGDNVHLTPNSVIAGNCKIGNNTTIGMCSTIYYSIEIGKNCLVFNNTAVSQNLNDGKVINHIGKISDNKHIYNK